MRGGAGRGHRKEKIREKGGSGSSRQPIHTKMRRTCHLGEQVGAVGIARTTSAAHFGVAVKVIRIVGRFARHARVGVVRAIAVIIRHLSNLLPVPAQQGGLSMVRQIARGGRATAGAATAGAHPMRAASGLARRSSAPIAEPMIIDMASTATGAVTMSPAGNGCEGDGANFFPTTSLSISGDPDPYVGQNIKLIKLVHTRESPQTQILHG